MLKVWISVGEPSGDIHAAALIKEIYRQNTSLHVRGILGPSLRGLEAELSGQNDSANNAFLQEEMYGIESLSIMGGTEIITAIPRALKMLGAIKKDLAQNKPDAVILVDAPDFNFRVGKIAHNLNIPVYYYISPKIWAWRSWRVNFLKKYVRKILCILPFEKEFYASHGVSVPYVGNPLVAAMNLPELEKEEVVSGRIGLMPGSRRKEITALMPIFAQTAEIILKKSPKSSFHCIKAPGISEEMLRSLWPQEIPLQIEQPENRYKFMKSCEIIIAASGTATLECALAGTPTIVTYKVSAISAFIIRVLAKIKYVSLPNLILNEEVFPELLQEKASANLISSTALEWLENKNSQRKTRNLLGKVKDLLGSSNAPKEAARIILQDLG